MAPTNFEQFRSLNLEGATRQKEGTMPLEIRKIYFTETDLRKALINFSILHKRYLRPEDIKEMIINNTDRVRVSVLVDQALELEENTINFSHSEVAAALLAFCMACKIPLPRSGVKELHANDDNIFLKIRFDQEINFEEYVICRGMQNASHSPHSAL